MAVEEGNTQTRVCPRCGTPDADQRFCSGCGLNLLMQPELPSAEEHEARLREEQWLGMQPSAAPYAATAVMRGPLTGETVTPGAAKPPFAGWWSRAGATLLDGLVLLIPAIIFGYVFAATVEILIVIATVFAYFLLMTRDGTKNGQTLGMQVMNIRVRRVDGAPVDTVTVAVRQVLMQPILGVLTLYVYFIPNYLWPLWDRENRALHDIVAKTRVVRTNLP